MAGDFEISQFRLADQTALLSFLAQAYPDDARKSDPAFWKWHYLENPHTPLDNIPLWVVKSGGQIVGQLATIPVQLKTGKEMQRAIWILDFIVHENFRGQGIGKRLVLAAKKYCPVMLTLGINEQSKGVFRSLDWVPLGTIHRYQKLLFAGNAVEEVAAIAPARDILNLCTAPLRSRVTKPEPGKRFVLRPVAHFDSAFDDLWQKAAPQWTCAVERGSRYLDWQFERQPGKKFETIGLYEGTQLCGYVVLFFRKAPPKGAPPKAAISDISFVSDASKQMIDALLRAALRSAIEKRAGSLVIDVLDARIEGRLRGLGFWRIEKSPEFMASATQNQELVNRAENWFLTRADSDVSIFERPNL